MKLTVLLLVLSALLSFSAFAEGHAEGNGGNSIVCETVNEAGEKIKYAHVLDLYEARELYRLETITEAAGLSETLLAQQIVSKLEDLDETYARLVRAEFEDVVRKINLLAPGQGLTPIPDSFHVSYPKYCDIKQLANYTKEHGILIDHDIWNLLDPIHRAALFVHEAVYKVERDLFSAKDSIHARKIVAYLFSKSGLTPKLWLEKIRPIALLQFDGGDNAFGQYGGGSNNSTISYTLRNAGNGPSSKITVSVKSSSPRMWNLDQAADECSGTNLAAGESCVFNVTFRAGVQGQTAGSYTAALGVTALVGGTMTRTLAGTAMYTWSGGLDHWSRRSLEGTEQAAPGLRCMIKGGAYFQNVAHLPAGTQHLYRRDSRGDFLCSGQWYYQIPPGEPQNSGSRFLRGCGTESPTWSSSIGTSGQGHFELSYLCAPVGSPDIVWGSGLAGATIDSCNTGNTYLIKPYFCF